MNKIRHFVDYLYIFHQINAGKMEHIQAQNFVVLIFHTHTHTHTHTRAHACKDLRLLVFTVKQIPEWQSDLSKYKKENWRVYRKRITYKMYYPHKLIYKIK